MARSEAQELEWSKAQEIVISVDLVKAAKQHLQFLAAIDNAGFLYDGRALDHAIFRYNNYWLPLLAKHLESPLMTEQLVVPLDCEWIWHCHRLNPVQYKMDCEQIYGRILDNKDVASTMGGTCTKQMEFTWNHMYPTEPYHLEKSHPSIASTAGGIIESHRSTEYDLVAAVKRQSFFLHKVPKSIMDDDNFLGEAVARYKGFLHLIKRGEEGNIRCYCVPTIDIDLIWHSHQLNPMSYYNDLTTILGKIVDHDERDSGDSAKAKLKLGSIETIKLWEDTFGRPYLMEGSPIKLDNARCWCMVGETGCDPNLNGAYSMVNIIGTPRRASVFA